VIGLAYREPPGTSAAVIEQFWQAQGQILLYYWFSRKVRHVEGRTLRLKQVSQTGDVADSLGITKGASPPGTRR
jgi:hypothetical protein